MSDIGLSRKETQRYSFSRALEAAANNDWTKAGLELEASRAVAAQRGIHAVDVHTFYVPTELQQRDLIVGTSTMGGYLVSTGNQSFIDVLRNRSVVYRMGARSLPGLRGSVAVPKLTSPGTGFWLATEATAITESSQVFGQMPLAPRNVGAYTEFSRQLLIQSTPGVDSVVGGDLAAVLGQAIDVAALRGTGTEQPTGIINTPNIGGVTITTGTITYDNVLEFQSDAAGGNALSENSGYVTTPAIAKILKQKPRFTNTDTPIWQGGLLNGNIEGVRAMSTNQMSSGQLLFGDFSQVVIGEWGGLEVTVNPYAGFTAGILGVRAFATVDVGVRYPAAFSLGTGITA